MLLHIGISLKIWNRMTNNVDPDWIWIDTVCISICFSLPNSRVKSFVILLISPCTVVIFNPSLNKLEYQIRQI